MNRLSRLCLRVHVILYFFLHNPLIPDNGDDGHLPSHVFPKYPCLQSHSKPSVFGVHVPSFLQGDEWQKFNSRK